jgi:trans-aconitate methyltransferase
MATEWDAESYHRVADPQFAWGRRLVETLNLAGDETVLDAGCGTGRLTRLLLERLPRGRVVAVDLSERMLEAARRYLDPEFAGRVEYVHGDLATLRLPQAVDLVFSTATFHWIPRQQMLFRNLWEALQPRGRVVAQWGAKENLSRLHARATAVTAEPAFQQYFKGWMRPVEFADEPTVRRRLAEAGFVDIETAVFPEPTTFTDRSAFEQFITTVNLRLYLARLPVDSLREAFVRRLVDLAAADRSPYTLDYVRINARASRP